MSDEDNAHAFASNIDLITKIVNPPGTTDDVFRANVIKFLAYHSGKTRALEEKVKEIEGNLEVINHAMVFITGSVRDLVGEKLTPEERRKSREACERKFEKFVKSHGGNVSWEDGLKFIFSQTEET